VSQSSDFCHHNPLCCFSTSVYYCCLFHYRLSPETFGYTIVFAISISNLHLLRCLRFFILKQWSI